MVVARVQSEFCGIEPEPFADAHDHLKGTAWFTRRIRAGWLGAAADIAAPAVFLAGNETSYITGFDLVVDGGLSL